MVELKFDNEYEVIIFSLTTILHHLERKDHTFVVQGISWLARIIQYSEILLFDRRYNIFPSYYIEKLHSKSVTRS